MVEVWLIKVKMIIICSNNVLLLFYSPLDEDRDRNDHIISDDDGNNNIKKEEDDEEEEINTEIELSLKAENTVDTMNELNEKDAASTDAVPGVVENGNFAEDRNSFKNEVITDVDNDNEKLVAGDNLED